MKKIMINSIIAGLVVTFTSVDVSANEVDLNLSASGANLNLAEAAMSGDLSKIKSAKEIVDAIKIAATNLKAAIEDLKKAEESGDAGDIADATTKVDALAADARSALSGAIPDTLVDAAAKWRESLENTGGGFGSGYTPPYIYLKAWEKRGTVSEVSWDVIMSVVMDPETDATRE